VALQKFQCVKAGELRCRFGRKRPSPKVREARRRSADDSFVATITLEHGDPVTINADITIALDA
jgi:hypothetical protein